MEHYRYFFTKLLNGQDINPEIVWWIDFLIISSLVLGTSFLLVISSRLIISRFLKKLAKRTKTNLDDYILSSKFPLYFSRLIPYFFLLWAIPFWIIDSPYTTSIIMILLNIYGVIVTILIFRSILQTLRSFLFSLHIT